MPSLYHVLQTSEHHLMDSFRRVVGVSSPRAAAEQGNEPQGGSGTARTLSVFRNKKRDDERS